MDYEKRYVFDMMEQGGPTDVRILTPFICDFGNRVKFGKGVFINHSAILSASGGIERYYDAQSPSSFGTIGDGSGTPRTVPNRPISSEEGMLYARENGLFKDICPRMVESAVDILEEMEI